MDENSNEITWKDKYKQKMNKGWLIYSLYTIYNFFGLVRNACHMQVRFTHGRGQINFLSNLY